MKTAFRDRHGRVDYLKAREEARRVRDDPSLLDSARLFLRERVWPDEHARPHAERWLALLDEGAERLRRGWWRTRRSGNWRARRARPSERGCPRGTSCACWREAEPDVLKRAQAEHVLRAAAGVTNHARFVVVGTGAVILSAKRHLPATMMLTREVVLCPDGVDDPEATSEPIDAPLAPEATSEPIDAPLAQGSPFHQTFARHADGVGPRTATLPLDRRIRASEHRGAEAGGAVAICPSAGDIAIAKLCASREKDIARLRAPRRCGPASPRPTGCAKTRARGCRRARRRRTRSRAAWPPCRRTDTEPRTSPTHAR